MPSEESVSEAFDEDDARRAPIRIGLFKMVLIVEVGRLYTFIEALSELLLHAQTHMSITVFLLENSLLWDVHDSCPDRKSECSAQEANELFQKPSISVTLNTSIYIKTYVSHSSHD